jgi:hypothetical protein
MVFKQRCLAVFLRPMMCRMPFEIIIGRGLACCLHPLAAWRVMTRPGRALVVAAYVGASFTFTLATLLFL